MANKIQKIHYIEDFSFSFVYPLDKQYNYIASVKTLGQNSFKAEWFWLEDLWVGENATIDGDEITINVREHNLPAGKVMVHVQEIDNGEEVGCFDVDPNVFLTFTNNVISTNPDEIDEEQSFNLNRLDAELVKVKSDLSDLDKGVDELENKFFEVAKAHHDRLDNLDKTTLANQEAISTLNENIDKISGDVESNFEKISNLEKEFADKDDFFGQMVEDFSTLSKKQNQLTTDISNFTSNYNDRLGRYDTALAEAQEELKDNTNKLDNVEKIQVNLLKQFDEEIKNINERITNLVINSSTGDVDLGDVYDQINQIKQDAAQLRRYVDGINNHEPFNPANLQSQIDALKTRLNYFDQFDHTIYATKTELSDYQPKGNYVTKSQLNQAIGEIDVTDHLDDYVKKTSLNSTLSNYAKKTDIVEYNDTNIKNRLTALEGINHNIYATKNELSAYQPKGNYATITDLSSYQPKGNYALTSDLTAYATKTELSAYQPKGNYLTENSLSNYVTKNELNVAVEGVDVSSQLTNYAKKSDLSTYATKTELQNAINDVDVSDQLKKYVKQTTLEDTLDDYATKSYVAEKYQPKGNYLTQHQDLSAYAKKSDLSTYVTESKLELAIQDFITSADLPDTGGIEVDLTNIKKDLNSLKTIQHDNYTTKTYVAENYQPKGNYLTEHQDLSTYATKSYVVTKINSIPQTDLTNYFTKTETLQQINSAKYDDSSVLGRLQQLEAIDHDQYLKEHQDISNLATKTQVSTLQQALNDLKNKSKEHVFVDLDSQSIGQYDTSKMYFCFSEQEQRKALYFYDDESGEWIPVEG